MGEHSSILAITLYLGYILPILGDIYARVLLGPEIFHCALSVLKMFHIMSGQINIFNKKYGLFMHLMYMEYWILYFPLIIKSS